MGSSVLLTFLHIHVPDRLEKKNLSLRVILQKLDLGGFVIFAPSCTMFLLAIWWAGDGTNAWNSPPTIGLLVGSGCLLIMFVCWIYYKGDSAIIPWNTARQRIVLCSCWTAFLQMGSLNTSGYFLIIWFQVSTFEL